MNRKAIAEEVLGLAKSLVASFVTVAYSAVYRQAAHEIFSTITVDIDIKIEEAEGGDIAKKIIEAEAKMASIAKSLKIANWWQDEGWYTDAVGLHCVYVFQYRGSDELVVDVFRHNSIKIEGTFFQD